ncbi:MAG: SDR family oxidoreductase, partial [Betaproteobacteria bacterium]|nr:SDR family oxidoreductase [Betaproteobacteria bacterium]
MHDDPQSPPPSERDPLPKIWDEKSTIGEMLRGRRGLIVGVANEQSIAFGCAAKLRGFGAEVALTYLNDKAKPYVEPLASQIGASMLLPLDVRDVDAIPRLFEQIKHEWAYLDFVIHSIAFAPKEDLQGRIMDSSREGFLLAMQVSCHSFIELAR